MHPVNSSFVLGFNISFVCIRPECFSSFNDIMYYDKYEEPRKSLEPAFSKDIFYAWQLECRLVFPKICNEKFIKLKIGSIMDIAKFRYL